MLIKCILASVVCCLALMDSVAAEEFYVVESDVFESPIDDTVDVSSSHLTRIKRGPLLTKENRGYQHNYPQPDPPPQPRSHKYDDVILLAKATGTGVVLLSLLSYGMYKAGRGAYQWWLNRGGGGGNLTLATSREDMDVFTEMSTAAAAMMDNVRNSNWPIWLAVLGIVAVVIVLLVVYAWPYIQTKSRGSKLVKSKGKGAADGDKSNGKSSKDSGSNATSSSNSAA